MVYEGRGVVGTRGKVGDSRPVLKSPFNDTKARCWVSARKGADIGKQARILPPLTLYSRLPLFPDPPFSRIKAHSGLIALDNESLNSFLKSS
jgi:hypothetical protein